jgi:F-type H+-transporting ATPase subunit b
MAAAAVAALLVTPALALAADAGGTKNVLEPDLVNSIVTLIVFGALLAVLYTFAWGPILQGLKARETAQFAAVEESKRARDEAAAMRAQVQAELAKAADQVRALLDEARADAANLRTTEREAGVKEAAAERDRARREIEVAKDTALDEIYRTAVDLATNLSAKTLGRQISADDHRKLLDESLAELKQSARTA